MAAHTVDATTEEGRLASVVVVVAVVVVAEWDSGDDARLGLRDWRGDTYGEDCGELRGEFDTGGPLLGIRLAEPSSLLEPSE